MTTTNDSGLVPRTARIEHECNGDGSTAHRHAATCGRTITMGTKYIEVMWEAPAFHSGTRVSMECARAYYGWKD